MLITVAMPRRKSGAAFIVHTMLGQDGAPSRRVVSTADWSELQQRMVARANAGKISWTANVSGWINSYYQNNQNDDAFYREYRNEKGITFRDDNNRIVYRLIRRCANPIGDGARGLPDSDQWSVEDDAYIQKDNGTGTFTGNYGNEVDNAKPGERYQFYHRIYNRGPDPLDRNIGTWRDYEYPNTSDDRANFANGGKGVGRNGTIRTLTGSTGVIPSTAGGERWCSQGKADPRSYNSNSTFNGEILCVSVPFDYNLRPSVSAGGGQGSTVEQGATNSNVDFEVNNDGPTQSRGTRWELVRFEVAPNAPASSSTAKSPNNNSAGCLTHNARPGVGSCQVIRNATGRVFNVGNTPLGRYIQDTGDTPIGGKICFVLSVSTPTETATPSWGHSTPACLLVVKKPKIQVQGGDLWVGRQFTGDTAPRQPGDVVTGTSTVGGRTYGSWAEYGLLATGSVSGMASGAALAGGVPQAQAIASQINKLTFANRPSYGAYTANPDRIPDYVATYGAGGAPVGGSLNLTSANGSYRTTGNLTLQTSGAIPRGRSIIVHGNNITIAGDIGYADTYTSLEDIPRVIIIADGNISVNPNVGRIDAWLIAKDTLYTCNQQAPLTINVCSGRLTMNGPVAAKEVSLRRTHGSEVAQGRDTPAETFNLRPDSILKAYEDAVDRGRAQTVYQVELPPRY
ncbi:hypothetical protein TM7_0399 [candidate division TM7 genomosp. GTL1]|nr:hypothetical protein TM7_0399 [candidate division TM7 genomosp. GTL1]